MAQQHRPCWQRLATAGTLLSHALKSILVGTGERCQPSLAVDSASLPAMRICTLAALGPDSLNRLVSLGGSDHAAAIVPVALA